MNPTANRLAALVLAAAAAAAAGQAPVTGENLLFAPPKDFKVGYSASHDTALITEFVPDGQTVEDWEQMLTVQVFHGASADPATFLQGLGERYMKACPGTQAKGIFSGHANGYVVSMLLLRCPNNPGTGKPETTAFRVTRGADALYSVQHAWRRQVSDAEVDTAMHALAAAVVCDNRTSMHPCPSLDAVTAPPRP